MARLHYSARVGAPRNHGAMYRGVDTRKAAPEVLVIPVTGDLVECPVCLGGVKLVGAPYSDRDAGIIQRKSKVYASHRWGGEPGGRQDKCSGSHAPLVS